MVTKKVHRRPLTMQMTLVKIYDSFVYHFTQTILTLVKPFCPSSRLPTVINVVKTIIINSTDLPTCDNTFHYKGEKLKID